MTDKDRSRLVQTLLGVYAYYDRELSELAISIWLDDLAGHSIEAVSAAFVRHRRDTDRGRFLPRSADILRQLQGDAAEAATVAWSRLLGEVRRVGSYGSPAVDQPARLALDAVGGWGALCRASERELAFMQRRFAEAFGVYEARIQRGDEPALIGSGAAPLSLQ